MHDLQWSGHGALQFGMCLMWQAACMYAPISPIPDIAWTL